MIKTIRFIQTVHSLFILVIFITFAVIPFYYPISAFGAFVVLPLLLLMTITFGVIIDNRLNRLLNNINTLSGTIKAHVKDCPYLKGMCC
ncbi:hypothetical protein [Thalassotalea hakodatensis]|uniref:hypothetical protein n=1 Tax=Thalassotalea hakodatensis TaxID=3030492 RepID=UPI0025731713|nr:hypothetical protein [Thalassotalea hakodatensis]